jgi:predicted transcriptional regulator
MPYSAGVAFLSVVPSFRNVEGAFAREAEKIGKEVDKAVDKGIGDGMSRASRRAGEEGRKAGANYGGAFAEETNRRLEAALRKLPKLEIDADSKPAERAIAEVRADLETLRDVKVGVGVDDIKEAEFFAEIARIEAAVEKLDHESASIEIKTNARAVLAELAAVAKLKAAATDAGKVRQPGALEAASPRRLEAASQKLGDIRVGVAVADKAALERLDALRHRMDKLRELEIDVDIPAHEYEAELHYLESELRRVAAETVNVRIRTNALQAAAEIAALRKMAEDPADVHVGKPGGGGADGAVDGAAYGGAFGRTARRAIAAALDDLPSVRLDASDADREIAGIRARLQELHDTSVDVDLNAGDVLAELQVLQERLRELGAQHPDVDVRVNVGSAIAELEALHAEINRIDGDDINVDVDVDRGVGSLRHLGEEAGVSFGRLGALISIGAALGTAIVPAAAAAAAAIGAIAAAATAAALGIGVFALGIFSVVKGVQALDKYQQATAKTAKSLGASQNAVANAVDGVSSAQRRLKATQEDVADGAKKAARDVIEAQKGVTAAQRDALKAEKDLARAKEDAIRQDEDRAFGMRDNALAQRQATLDVADAKKALDALTANPRASKDELEAASITFEQRKLQYEELGVAGKRLQEDQARVAKDGADNVVAAQDRVRDATDNVGKAQQRLADSIEAQTKQQRDGQRQLIEAQQAVVQSQRALQQAYVSTGSAGGAALQNLQTAMDNLSPAGQKFARFIFGLKSDFKQLQAAAEEGMLPGLQTAIEMLLPYFPAIKDFVSNVASTLGDIFIQWATALKDPIFVQFFGYIRDTASPLLQGMSTFALNVVEGLLGIVNGLSGFNGPIGGGLLQWSEGFKTWSENLSTNKGWQAFLDYIKENGPKVAGLLKQVWQFTKNLVEAAAPIGAVVVEAFTLLFQWLNKIDPKDLTVIVGAIAGIAGALLLVSAATALLAAGTAGLVVVLIGAIIAGLVIAYNKFAWFHNAVDATVHAVGAAWDWLWGNVLKPVFTGIGDAAKSLWEGFLKPLFVIIEQGFRNGAIVAGWMWKILGPIFGFIGDAVRILIGIFEWLYQHVFVYIFAAIGVAFRVLWAIVQVVFGLFSIGIKILGAVFGWLWDNAIKPVWDKIKPFFEWLGDIIDKHVRPKFEAGMKALGAVWDWLVDQAKKPIKFVVETILNDGLLRAYNFIAKKFNVKPDDVHIDLPKAFDGKALGGAVYGPGTKTSDSVPTMLSRGEHVFTADEVDKAGGHPVIYALRRIIKSGGLTDLLPGYAAGGAIGDRSSRIGDGLGDFLNKAKKKATDIYDTVADFVSDPAGTLKAMADKLFKLVPGSGSDAIKQMLGVPKSILDKLISKVTGLLGGGMTDGTAHALPGPMGTQQGGSGYKWQEAILRFAFGKNIQFFSDYRPGAITVTGNRSYHAVGRAVDMTPSMAIFNWIRSRYGSTTRELIYTPAGAAQIKDGRPHIYSPIVAKGHYSHVHWAYDQGGMIPPGLSQVYNGTGRPEPVLSQRQWRDISALAQGGDGPAGPQYTFHFRDSDLDHGRLQAIQDRQAAIARQGRAR